MFEAHGPMVFGLCNLLLRDRQEAEDALQQTFLSGYRSMLDGTDPKEPSAWLAAIARNECLSRLRRRVPESVRLRDADLGAREDVAEVVDRRTEMAALSEAIAGLPPAQRRAVILRDFYGLSYREVSAALGVTGPAVESLLFRSRKRLQERLQSFRAASGVAALPLAVRDTLARSVPGFSSGLSTSGLGAAGAGLSAKLVSTSAAAKIAALALAAGIGTMTIVHESDSSDRHRGKAHSRAAIAADAPPPSSPTRPEATTREQFDVDAAHAIPSARLDHPAPTVEAWGPPPPAPTWEAVPVPSRMALPATVTFSSRNHRGLPRPTADTLGQSRRGATDGDGESRGSAPPPIAADVVPFRQADGSGDAGARGPGAGRATGTPVAGGPSPSAASSPPSAGNLPLGESSPPPRESGSSSFDASAGPSGAQQESGGWHPGLTSGGDDGAGSRSFGGTGWGGEWSKAGSGSEQAPTTPASMQPSAGQPPITPENAGSGETASSRGGGATAPAGTTTAATTTSNATTPSTTPGENFGAAQHSGGSFPESSASGDGGSPAGTGGGSPSPSGGGAAYTTDDSTSNTGGATTSSGGAGSTSIPGGGTTGAGTSSIGGTVTGSSGGGGTSNSGGGTSGSGTGGTLGGYVSGGGGTTSANSGGGNTRGAFVGGD